MFLDLDKKESTSVAAIDDSGFQITYGELCRFSSEFYTKIKKRTLIFILSENTIESMAGYVAALSSGIVPLLLSSNTDKELLDNLISSYKPEYIWLPARMTVGFNFTPVFRKSEYELLKTDFESYELNEELSLLLPTSGSTGSPKLVRHSYNNVQSNAKNVSELFELNSSERAIAILPMHYTMGLSVITSHLYAGATILLAKGNLTDPAFWKFIKENKATSFTGVPYSFEILHRLRINRMDLPHLKLFTQGGGKLKPELFRFYAEFASQTNRKFIATYGQTEGTARMAYLPANLAIAKNCSIGNAIPNGQLSLVDDQGKEITTVEATGEMVYKGPNVTMGYALESEDLIKGDERNGVLFTGDIVQRDSDGYYFIVGRKSRFLKIYGFRVSLDETEQMIKSAFQVDCVCSGSDEKMKIYITDNAVKEAVHKFITDKTGLFHLAVEVIVIDKIHRNEAGKVIPIH